MKVAATATRSRLSRSKLGKSTPDFPAPIGKVAGAWIWARPDVDQVLASKEMS